ncbi:MAG: tetratricopeptide repeat protein [Enterobacterales bacterium]|nr:tetratricopeptide repeat protein [Enterobacterales bacterium]
MSYQTEEQQIEQLKDWWKENGTPLLIGAALGLAGFFGWEFWDEQQATYQSSASDQYNALNKQIEAKNIDQQTQLAKAIKKDFSDTAYAALSAFQLAKLAVNKEDFDTATAELKWIINKNIADDMSGIAKIRLARINISLKQAEQAIELLDFEADSGFYELANLVKGDAYMALGKSTEALEAYQTAVAKGQTSASHPSLKLAIEELVVAQLDSMEMPQADRDTETDVNSEDKLDSGSDAKTKAAKQEASE